MCIIMVLQAGAESIAELQHSARLGKTFPVGWLGGSEKLRIRLNLTTAGAWA